MVAVVDNKLLRRSQMAFNPIHPRGIRGDKDHFDIGLLTPLDDFGPMMGRQVIQDQIDLASAWVASPEAFEESKHLLPALPCVCCASTDGLRGRRKRRRSIGPREDDDTWPDAGSDGLDEPKHYRAGDAPRRVRTHRSRLRRILRAPPYRASGTRFFSVIVRVVRPLPGPCTLIGDLPVFEHPSNHIVADRLNQLLLD